MHSFTAVHSLTTWAIICDKTKCQNQGKKASYLGQNQSVQQWTSSRSIIGLCAEQFDWLGNRFSPVCFWLWALYGGSGAGVGFPNHYLDQSNDWLTLTADLMGHRSRRTQENMWFAPENWCKYQYIKQKGSVRPIKHANFLDENGQVDRDDDITERHNQSSQIEMKITHIIKLHNFRTNLQSSLQVMLPYQTLINCVFVEVGVQNLMNRWFHSSWKLKGSTLKCLLKGIQCSSRSHGQRWSSLNMKPKNSLSIRAKLAKCSSSVFKALCTVHGVNTKITEMEPWHFWAPAPRGGFVWALQMCN